MYGRMGGGEGVVGAMVIPDAPDDEYAHAYNAYVRALGFGLLIEGRNAAEWLTEAERLRGVR